MKLAIRSILKDNIGKAKCRKLSAKENGIPGMDMPETGSTFRRKAKTYIKIRPKKNTGTDRPIKPHTVRVKSSAEYCFNADTMPNIDPIMIEISIETPISSSVAGKRMRIASVIGSKVIYEYPRFPLNSPCNHRA